MFEFVENTVPSARAPFKFLCSRCMIFIEVNMGLKKLYKYLGVMCVCVCEIMNIQVVTFISLFNTQLNLT